MNTDTSTFLQLGCEDGSGHIVEYECGHLWCRSDLRRAENLGIKLSRPLIHKKMGSEGHKVVVLISGSGKPSGCLVHHPP